MIKLSLCLAAGLGLSAAAEETRKLSFESPIDRFELTLGQGAGTVGGKPADLGALREVLPALTNEVSNDCPAGLTGRPDVTVREGALTRRVYIARGLVATDDHCLNVGGEGLFFVPIHRDFLIGPKQDGLTLKGPIELARDGARLLTLEQRGDGWVAKEPGRLVNHDFFAQFVNSLTSFKVRVRVGLGVTKGRLRLTLKNDGRTYEFYRLPNLSWGLKKPGAKFLVTSDDWSPWYDFDDRTIDDPRADQIRAAGDAATASSARQAALARLEAAWSPNLRALYHRLLLEEPGEDALRLIALKRLRAKPSLETAAVLIELLDRDVGDEVKHDAAQILKLHNPRGPKAGAAAAWREWLKGQRR